MGLRMALGATAARLEWLVLRQAFLLVLAGLALAFRRRGVARWLRGLPFGVEPLEPAVLSGTVLSSAVRGHAGRRLARAAGVPDRARARPCAARDRGEANGTPAAGRDTLAERCTTKCGPRGS
jgi:hypothetical protein